MNNVFEVLLLITVGGILGSSGQAGRVGLGLLKMRRYNNFYFDRMRVVVNLLVGFALGAVAISIIMKGQILELTVGRAVVVVISGYAGGDIIERIVKLYAAKVQQGQKLTVPPPSLAAPKKLLLNRGE